MSPIKILRKLAMTAAVTAAVGATALGVSSPAQAYTENNGVCNAYEVCLYYLSGFGGYMEDFYWDTPDYTPWKFWKTTVPVNDNTGSAQGESISTVACIYEHANYGGHLITWVTAGNDTSDFGFYRNRASSHEFEAWC